MAAVGGHLRCLSIGNCIISPPATALRQHHYSQHSINNYPAAQTSFSWSLGRFHPCSMFLLPNYNNYDSFIAVIDGWARPHLVSPTSSRAACWTRQVKLIFNLYRRRLTVRKVTARHYETIRVGPFYTVNGILICCSERGGHGSGHLDLALREYQFKVFKTQNMLNLQLLAKKAR